MSVKRGRRHFGASRLEISGLPKPAGCDIALARSPPRHEVRLEFLPFVVGRSHLLARTCCAGSVSTSLSASAWSPLHGRSTSAEGLAKASCEIELDRSALWSQPISPTPPSGSRKHPDSQYGAPSPMSAGEPRCELPPPPPQGSAA